MDCIEQKEYLAGAIQLQSHMFAIHYSLAATLNEFGINVERLLQKRIKNKCPRKYCSLFSPTAEHIPEYV